MWYTECQPPDAKDRAKYKEDHQLPNAEQRAWKSENVEGRTEST